MKSILYIFLLTPILLFSQSYYFPPQDFNTWEKSEYKCDSLVEAGLIDFVLEKNTKAFIILKEGKILMEAYSDDFGRDSVWYWASAGKTMTSTLIGIAANNGDLNIEDPTEDYLGDWTVCSQEDQSKVKIKHQLTMTGGFDETISAQCTSPDCLDCIAEPGTRWYYHNSPYTLLLDVYESATGKTKNEGVLQEIGNKIGMFGLYVPAIITDNQVFYSRARDMARFGLLHLANGTWDGETIFDPVGYFEDSKNTSQDLNKAYGYLWWLNGKESYLLPGSGLEFSGSIIPSAPDDMYMALGKNDQKIYIVPSEDLVVVRMGDSADGVNFALSDFDEVLWEKISELDCLLTTNVSGLDKTEWNVVPNPANEFLNIQGTDFDSWEVFNLLGERILTGNSKVLNVSDLTAGSYWLKLLNKNKASLGTKKFVVQ